MKKTSILSLVFLISAVFNFSFANDPREVVKPGDPTNFTTLIIDANVTVVLVNNPRATLQVIGKDAIYKFLRIEKSADTLVIGAIKNRDLKSKAIIYVPAMLLSNIRINSSSDVSSYQPLQSPVLNILVNGDCRLRVSNIGELNLSSTESYSIDQTMEVRHVPVGLVRPF